jgi:ATP adenylyltransferase/5',5'''-P-1,P-4-tetraphosphate phosphorylase II
MQAYPHGALAYYNRGPLSGASQPHKHIQLVPLPLDVCSPAAIPTAAIIETALEKANQGRVEGSTGAAVVEVRELPFQAFASRISPGCVNEATVVTVVMCSPLPQQQLSCWIPTGFAHQCS